MDLRNYRRRLAGLVMLGLFSTDLLFSQSSPGAAEDAEAERRKILKAADQVDRMDAAVEDMKARISSLEKVLEELKQQSNSLKESLVSAAAQSKKEKDSLLEEVSKMIAERKAKEGSAAPAPPNPPSGRATSIPWPRGIPSAQSCRPITRSTGSSSPSTPSGRRTNFPKMPP